MSTPSSFKRSQKAQRVSSCRYGLSSGHPPLGKPGAFAETEGFSVLKSPQNLYNVQKITQAILNVNQKLNRGKKMLAAQCRMARAALGFTVRELAEKAGVSHDTIVRIEAGGTLKDSTVAKVRATFEAAGVEFTDGNQPGVKIKTPDGTIVAPASLPREPLG
jgi:DNA-binding XRE family transcriptional regulator